MCVICAYCAQNMVHTDAKQTHRKFVQTVGLKQLQIRASVSATKLYLIKVIAICTVHPQMSIKRCRQTTVWKYIGKH